jgi:23S rRNA (pseudouridine1915-N3)-methyltransferase
MKQILLSVGKRHDPALQAAIDDFTARLNRDVETSWHLVKPSGADEPTARRVESAAVLDFVRSDDFVVLLDERGRELSSEALSAQHDGWLARPGRVVFVIGGAYGVDDALRARANYVLALSKLVFPHQLVRLILAEQLYRTRMISKNHPYHHS